MVDRPESLKKIVEVKYYAGALYDVEVSQNDTITLEDFVSTENLKKAVIMKKSDGNEVTCTHTANNKITVTGAGTNMACILFAFGRRA